jgi:hypothetical protein
MTGRDGLTRDRVKLYIRAEPGGARSRNYRIWLFVNERRGGVDTFVRLVVCSAIHTVRTSGPLTVLRRSRP